MKKSSLVDDGCVLYLSNRKKSSTTWSDFSKGGNNGTVNGATVARNGYSFDGVSNFINISDNSSLKPINATTISLWVNDTSAVNSTQAIIAKWDYQTQGTWSIDMQGGVNSGFPIFRVANDISDSGNNWRGFPIAVSKNTWTHIVFTFNSGQIAGYINGISQILISTGVIANTLTNGTASVKIGMFGSDLTRFFTGSIGEVRIYNRALSASEILNHYGKTRKFYGV